MKSYHGATFFSIHYSDKEINFEMEMKRQENPYDSKEITSALGRSFPIEQLQFGKKPKTLYTMIVFYNKNFEVMAYGKRTFTDDEF